jgi:hypothetical protein
MDALAWREEKLMIEDGGKLPGGFVSVVTQVRAKNAAKISYRTNPMKSTEKER